MTKMYRLHKCKKIKPLAAGVGLSHNGWWSEEDMAKMVDSVGGMMELKNNNCPWCGEDLKVIERC